MRHESKTKVVVREVEIGGQIPLVCLPLAPRTREDILTEAEIVTKMKPDLLEWRADAFEEIKNLSATLQVLEKLRTLIADLPLIFTCRIESEGGMTAISQSKRLEVIQGVIDSGLVDVVDIELCNETEFKEKVISNAAANGVKTILSYHNFTKTPSEALIIDKLVESEKCGADIAKVAVMPQDQNDVLTLLSATNKARTEIIKGPVITISMGELGVISRVAGGVFGSDITFGVGTDSTAPGQIKIADLRSAMKVICPQ